MCLCVHALPPASILFGFREAVIVTATVGQSFRSKDPTWLFLNQCSMILLN